ncbi:hypothetical protein IAQ61_007842 [Plenodomus lingam]|uniref:uncharacterized protein n=1 Tax=Leptosphaeria maculans TaxID=5022 RepID=UPI003333EABD|nr:hypothetical protein IAQ61_007842 [Plenodomus lingam]
MHEGLRITSTKTGKQYLFDFCGSQYGIHRALWKTPVYEAQFSAKIGKAYPFGTHKHIFGILRNIKGIPRLTYGIVGDAAERLEMAIVAWEKKNRMPLSRIRSQNDVDFGKSEKELIETCRAATSAFVEHNDFTAIFQDSIEYARTHPGESGELITRTFREFLK